MVRVKYTFPAFPAFYLAVHAGACLDKTAVIFLHINQAPDILYIDIFFLFTNRSIEMLSKTRQNTIVKTQTQTHTDKKNKIFFWILLH